MNKYLELKKKQQEEVNNFPMFFAFSNKQFEEGIKKFGLTKKDTGLLCSIPGGGFIKKTDSERFKNLFTNHNKEMESAIKEDKDGTGFIFSMFNYELANHEYCVTGSIEDTIDLLGITHKDIENNPALKKGLNLAKSQQYDCCYW